MSIKLTQHEKNQTYFCTFTCVDWLPLFELTDFYDEIYKWFGILKTSGSSVVGFVIMPNHLHALIYVNAQSINKVLGNGKRFMAYEIVERLKAAGRADILKILSERVTDEERKRKKLHRVFETSSDIKPCNNRKFILQKLDYMHRNPVSGKWNLAASFLEYPHSSVAFYELNERHPLVEIIHYEEVGASVSSPSGDDT
jgi:REP element-mobilizing transposase RayT